MKKNLGFKQWLVFGTALTLAACATTTNNVGGQTPMRLQTISPPSTLPPADYSGSEWVDDRGCHFIKVDRPAWVARVNSKGKHICGGVASHISLTDEVSPLTTIAAPSMQGAPQVMSSSQSAPSAIVVQVGAFRVQSNVDRAVNRITSYGYRVVVTRLSNGLQAVRVLGSGQSAPMLRQEMIARGYVDAIVYGY